jgi:5-methylcytosine-specific restriction endonuclease McrA
VHRKTARCDDCAAAYILVRLLAKHLRWRQSIARRCELSAAAIDRKYKSRLAPKHEWDLIGVQTSCPFCGTSNLFQSPKEHCAGCNRRHECLRRKIRLKCLKESDPNWYANYRAARNAEETLRRRGPKTPFDISKAELRQMRLKAKKCAICGQKLPKSPSLRHVDHIWLRSLNGTNTKDNLRVTCRECNLKRPRDLSDLSGHQLNIFMESA